MAQTFISFLQEVNVSPQSLRYIWYPELEIYGLERFGRQRVLKEMSGVRIRKNKTIHYELGYAIYFYLCMLYVLKQYFPSKENAQFF